MVEARLATTASDQHLAQPDSRRYLVFAVVSAAMLMASIDQTIVATALGTLQHDLHAPVNWSSWTITVYALGQIIAMPLAGAISDQLGRKRAFLGALILFGVSSLACALVSNIYVLVAFRAVQALGGGAFMPAGTGIVADMFGRNRDRAIALFTSIFPVGGLIGPVVGGLIVTYWSWRGIFLVNVPVALVVFVLASGSIHDRRAATSRRLDLTGVMLLAAGLLGVMFAISHLGGPGAAPGDPAFLVPLVMGVLLLIALAGHSRRSATPFVPPAFITGRGFAAMNGINFLYGVAVLGFATLVPLYGQERYGLSPLSSGTLLTARAVGTTLVAALATFALRRTGVRLPMMVGFLLSAGGLLMLGLNPAGVGPYAWLALAGAVTGLGAGLSVPASNNAVLQLAPESTAVVAGLRGMFRQMGGITGVSVVTATLARSADPAMTQARIFVAFSVLLACVVPAVLLIPEHKGQW